MQIALNVNGQIRDVEVDEDTPLLWVVRESLGLTGTKFGCGIAMCGACTVHINGVAARSCSIPAAAAQGQVITTIEGLATAGQRHAVQQAWIEHQVPQCGYCQSGMIMAVTALLAKNTQPSDEQIDAEITNICRCGTYERVRRAIHSVAAQLRAMPATQVAPANPDTSGAPEQSGPERAQPQQSKPGQSGPGQSAPGQPSSEPPNPRQLESEQPAAKPAVLTSVAPDHSIVHSHAVMRGSAA